MVRLLEELLHPDMFNLKSKFKFKVKNLDVWETSRSDG